MGFEDVAYGPLSGNCLASTEPDLVFVSDGLGFGIGDHDLIDEDSILPDANNRELWCLPLSFSEYSSMPS